MGLPIDPVNASWKSSVGGIRDPARPRLARSVLRHFGRKQALRRRCLLVIGLLTSLSCAAPIIQMIVAITTVQIAMIPKALSFLNWVDELLYLPEACVYRHLDLVDLLGPGKLSLGSLIAHAFGYQDSQN